MSCDVLKYPAFESFHEQYYRKNKPVILRGIRDVRPLKLFGWSSESLVREMGDATVPVLATPSGFLSYERDVEHMSFREFIRRSFGDKVDPALHYYFKNPTTALPLGADDSDDIPELRRYLRKAMLKNVWISGGGITVGLHFDAAENFNFQIRGRKIFNLYPPGVAAFYPQPMFSQTAHISGVFRAGPDPDLTRFPKFDPNACLRVQVCEGDVLYLPAYWWHQVESLGDENVNLNFWWLPPAKKQLVYWNQALRGYAQLSLRFFKFGNLQKAPKATHG
jgi:hypothetical protein